MDVTAIAGPGIESTESARQKAKLKEACDGVEGMFLNILLKQGMEEMLDNAQGHSASALGYALEQTADEIAKNGDTGIADNIYARLSANL